MIIEVPKEEIDSRLDKFLKRKFKNFNQALIEKHLRKGNIKINDLKVKANQKLFPGELIFVSDKIQFNEKIFKLDHNSDTSHRFIKSIELYQNEDFIIFNKPSGLPVQGGSKIKKNLDDLLKQTFPKENFKLVHRIDKDTSGIIIIAKNLITAKKFSEYFKNQMIKKSYLAVVYGNPGKCGIINSDIINIKTSINNNKNFKATTKFINLFSNKMCSLLALQPVTGRKHQIRLHLLDYGTPIIGDKKYYKPNENFKNFSKNKLHLHSQFLKFPEGSNFNAPIPNYFLKTIDEIGATSLIPSQMPEYSF